MNLVIENIIGKKIMSKENNTGLERKSNYGEKESLTATNLIY